MGYVHTYNVARAVTVSEWGAIVDRTTTLLRNLPQQSTSTRGGYVGQPLRLAWASDVNMAPQVGPGLIQFDGSGFAEHYRQPHFAPLVEEPEYPSMSTQIDDWCKEFHLVNQRPMLSHDGPDLGHEAFTLELSAPVGTKQFCKTNQKPYDLIVCAVLILCHTLAPGYLTISSDGSLDEWQPAFDWAASLLPEVALVMPIAA